MTGIQPSRTVRNGNAPLAQLRIWHLAVVVLYTAIAIVDIKAQQPSDPVLISVAAVGFVGYGCLVCLFWRLVRPYESHLGMLWLVGLYLIAMAALYLAATLIYLAIERAYLTGSLRALFRFFI